MFRFSIRLQFSYIGVITGVRPGVFSISMNERYGLKGGYIGLIEWIFNINRNQSFVTFAMRDMLTQAQTYDQAVNYLAQVKLTAPCYYILAGPKAGQVTILARIFLINIFDSSLFRS